MSELNNLNSVISGICDEGLLTIRPGGNYGDTLIYKGAKKFFADNEIKTLSLHNNSSRGEVPPGFDLTSVKNLYISTFDEARILNEIHYLKHRVLDSVSCIYIHGGGNFNDYWYGGILCYKAAARYFDVPIIIGPQSCQYSKTDPVELFKKTDNETHFFAREKYSFDIMKEVADKVGNLQVHLEEDTALYLEPDDLQYDEKEGGYSLVALRGDKESSTPFLNEGIDPPILFNDVSVAEENFESFVSTTGNAKKIYTDRLHVAILGSILNKSVQFYCNSYHKNKGVYNMSLACLDHIEFVE